MPEEFPVLSLSLALGPGEALTLHYPTDSVSRQSVFIAQSLGRRCRFHSPHLLHHCDDYEHVPMVWNLPYGFSGATLSSPAGKTFMLTRAMALIYFVCLLLPPLHRQQGGRRRLAD